MPVYCTVNGEPNKETSGEKGLAPNLSSTDHLIILISVMHSIELGLCLLILANNL